jgi:glycosyltransferase involved in cell wall biosynthesis
MRIGIDISQIIYEGTGVARYTRGLVEAILKYDKKNDWFFFFSSLRRDLDRDLKKRIRARGYKLILHKAPPTFLTLVWNSIHRLRVEKLVGKFDWYITSDWTEPPSDFPKATVVHDLVYLRYPETLDPVIEENQKKRLKWVKKESRLIFADSTTTGDDLVSLVDINKKRIKVIYPGVEVEKTNKNKVSQIVKKFNLKKDFILTVGKIEPRKNFKRLIEAFTKLKSKEAELVIVGSVGWDKIETPQPNIKFLGYVTDEELSALYSSCLFFIYPSIWEGFGYPVVEAMTHGAPVATSNTSSLKEIGQGAAYLFDPLKINEIQKAMEVLINDDPGRKKLSREGEKRARQFTWKNYYEKLIKTLYDNRN